MGVLFAREHANTSEDTLPELRVRQTRRLLHLMYVQASFLALTYVLGVWLATTLAAQVSVTLPEVVIHVAVASTFASLTAALAFLAILQRLKWVAGLNLLLFLVTVGVGITGFVLLGDASSATQASMTNLSMAVGIGIGMPVTGYSIAKAARIVQSNGQSEAESSPASAMAFLAIVALSLTAIGGVATRATALATALNSFYGTAVTIHFALAAVTVSLVLGVLVFSVLEGLSTGSSSPQLVQQRVVFSLLGLAAASLAGGAGVIAAGVVAVSSAGMSYVVLMAEVAVLVYASLILVIAAPFRLRPVKGGPSGMDASQGSVT